MKLTENYRKLKQLWNNQDTTGEIKDEDNPVFILSMTSTKL